MLNVCGPRTNWNGTERWVLDVVNMCNWLHGRPSVACASMPIALKRYFHCTFSTNFVFVWFFLCRSYLFWVVNCFLQISHWIIKPLWQVRCSLKALPLRVCPREVFYQSGRAIFPNSKWLTLSSTIPKRCSEMSFWGSNSVRLLS